MVSVQEKEKSGAVTTVESVENEVLSDMDKKDMKNLDKAYQYKQELEGLEIDPKLEKKMDRKIDFCLLPIIGLLMACQNMDKTTNSYAAIMGLREDLNMSGQTYSWVGSSFYFGYLVFQYPANLLLQKYPVSKTLGVFVIIWGAVLMCHAACKNSASFLACRVILGCLESLMNPAYMLLTSMWYSREENSMKDLAGKNDKKSRLKISQQFIRTCVWFGLQGIGSFLGATILYGLYIHTYSIASWRLLYFVTGAKTIALGIISVIHIPDIPVKAWFLNETEKKYMVARSKANQQGFGNTNFKKDQVIEALTDLRTWLLGLYVMAYTIANGGYTNFGSILLHEDFGFDTKTSLLLNMVGGTIDILSPLAAIILGFFIKSRLLIGVSLNVYMGVAMIVLAFAGPREARIWGYYSFYLSCVTVSVGISAIASNVAGSSKKSLVYAIFSIGYCVGNIIGPQTYREEQAPKYIGARTALIIAFFVSAIFLLMIYFIEQRENKRRDRERDALGDKYQVDADVNFADLTDKQNPEFRYCP